MGTMGRGECKNGAWQILGKRGVANLGKTWREQMLGSMWLGKCWEDCVLANAGRTASWQMLGRMGRIWEDQTVCVCVCVTALAWSFSRHFRSCDGAPAALPGSTVAVEPVRAEPRDRVKRALAMRTHVSALRIPLRRPLVPRTPARRADRAEGRDAIGPWALAARLVLCARAPAAFPVAAVTALSVRP